MMYKDANWADAFLEKIVTDAARQQITQGQAVYSFPSLYTTTPQAPIPVIPAYRHIDDRCRYCRAAPGEQCVTATGNPAPNHVIPLEYPPLVIREEP